MKTKIKHTSLLLLAFLSLNFTSKAQTFDFNSNLSCDVKLNYEMWDAACQVCTFGTIIVNAAGVSIPLCAGYYDMCINIMEIDYCPVSSNHLSVNMNCHMVGPSGQTGTMAAGCCSGASWTVIMTGPTTWLIQ